MKRYEVRESMVVVGKGENEDRKSHAVYPHTFSSFNSHTKALALSFSQSKSIQVPTSFFSLILAAKITAQSSRPSKSFGSFGSLRQNSEVVKTEFPFAQVQLPSWPCGELKRRFHGTRSGQTKIHSRFVRKRSCVSHKTFCILARKPQSNTGAKNNWEEVNIDINFLKNL